MFCSPPGAGTEASGAWIAAGLLRPGNAIVQRMSGVAAKRQGLVPLGPAGCSGGVAPENFDPH